MCCCAPSAFAGHILIIDHFTQKVDGVELSLRPVSGDGGALRRADAGDGDTRLGGARGLYRPVLYVGIFSSGVGYTLQILAQKDSDPTVVSLLLSLESVFATVAGALILGDRMSGRSTWAAC